MACQSKSWFRLNQSIQDFVILLSLNLLQNQARSAIFVIAADFGFRRVPWGHRNVHCQRKYVSQFEKMEWTSVHSHHAWFTRATLDKQTERGTNPHYLFGLHGADRLSARAGAAGCSRSRKTPLYTSLGDAVKKVVEFTAESITSLLNLVRIFKIRCRILLKLPISEQTPLI